MKKSLTIQQQKVAVQMIRYYNALVTGVVLNTKQVLQTIRKTK